MAHKPEAIVDVWPDVHEYEYGGVPPEVPEAAIPSQLPKQEAFVMVTFSIKGNGSVILYDCEVLHPLASNRVALYMLAQTTTDEVVNEPGIHV